MIPNINVEKLNEMSIEQLISLYEMLNVPDRQFSQVYPTGHVAPFPAIHYFEREMEDKARVRELLRRIINDKIENDEKKKS